MGSCEAGGSLVRTCSRRKRIFLGPAGDRLPHQTRQSPCLSAVCLQFWWFKWSDGLGASPLRVDPATSLGGGGQAKTAAACAQTGVVRRPSGSCPLRDCRRLAGAGTASGATERSLVARGSPVACGETERSLVAWGSPVAKPTAYLCGAHRRGLGSRSGRALAREFSVFRLPSYRGPAGLCRGLTTGPSGSRAGIRRLPILMPTTAVRRGPKSL